jgi:hypothetical protein
MLILMNSAVMPTDGYYECETVSWEDAKELFQSVGSKWKSTIGYPNTQKIIESVFGVSIPLCNDATEFKSGDCALCFRLKYRILTKEEKAQGVHGKDIADYEVKFVRYQATRLKKGL